MEIMSMSPSVNKSLSSSVRTIYLMYQPGFSANISTLPSPVAYELDFRLCIQRYHTVVSNGVTNTTLLSSQILETEVGEIWIPNSEGTSYTAKDSFISIEGNTFGISNTSLQDLSNTLATLDAVCYQLTNPDQPFFCDNENGFPMLSVLQNSTDPLSAITTLWNNMAISMTNAFRSGAGGDTQVGTFEGIARTPIAFVQTNYLWLILPITLVFLTLVFLLATILKSQRLGSRIWKSSNLATLQGLHSELHTKLGGMSSISEMEERAKTVEVRFNLDMEQSKARNDVEYRLVESRQEEYWI